MPLPVAVTEGPSAWRRGCHSVAAWLGGALDHDGRTAASSKRLTELRLILRVTVGGVTGSRCGGAERLSLAGGGIAFGNQLQAHFIAFGLEVGKPYRISHGAKSAWQVPLAPVGLAAAGSTVISPFNFQVNRARDQARGLLYVQLP